MACHGVLGLVVHEVGQADCVGVPDGNDDLCRGVEAVDQSQVESVEGKAVDPLRLTGDPG